MTTVILFSPVVPAGATTPDPSSVNETATAPSMRFEGEAVVFRTLHFVADIDRSKSWEWINYEWLADGQVYSRAGTYTTLEESMFGRRISVRMTMKEFGADPVVYVSEETPPVRGYFDAARGSAGEPVLGQAISAGIPSVGARPALATAPERSYVWSRNGVPIPGADAETYTVTEADLGAELHSTVTLSAPEYLTWRHTASHGTGFRGYLTLASDPTITWNRTAESNNVPTGTVLRASAPPVTGTAPADLSYAYQWYASDGWWSQAIPGATGPEYIAAPEYIGKTINVGVTPVAAHYTGRTRGVTSNLRPYIWGSFAGVTAPTIKGTALPGQVLTAVPGIPTPVAETVMYEWYRDEQKLAVWSTDPTYTVTREDRGHRITVRARYHRTHYYYSTTALSKPIAPRFDARAFMDFTRDDKSDVLARDKAGIVWVYPGNGTGGWKPRYRLQDGHEGYVGLVRPGDLNSDGLPDYLAQDAWGKLWMSDGPSHGFIGSGWTGYTIIAPDDFNGDIEPDVMARDKYGALYLYPGNGTGGFKPRVKVGSGWQNFTTILGPGDFDGDGNADVMARDKYGVLYLYPGNGTGGWKARVKIGSGWQYFTSISAGGDFNGDGNADVMARDKYGVLYLYPGNGTGGWKPRVKIGSGWQYFTSIF
ncbi:FG-GAP-like repeat-containing protein [Pseudarthrobacter sp. NPDC092419]|uniref:FG-GAP-like repeat-containing protein n=1 Tax=Pseudarthrobacter sp. NPDC092419 TaxID=3364414 RepID=UPI0038128A45